MLIHHFCLFIFHSPLFIRSLADFLFPNLNSQLVPTHPEVSHQTPTVMSTLMTEEHFHLRSPPRTSITTSVKHILDPVSPQTGDFPEKEMTTDAEQLEAEAEEDQISLAIHHATTLTEETRSDVDESEGEFGEAIPSSIIPDSQLSWIINFGDNVYRAYLQIMICAYGNLADVYDNALSQVVSERWIEELNLPTSAPQLVLPQSPSQQSTVYEPYLSQTDEQNVNHSAYESVFENTEKFHSSIRNAMEYIIHNRPVSRLSETSPKAYAQLIQNDIHQVATQIFSLWSHFCQIIPHSSQELRRFFQERADEEINAFYMSVFLKHTIPDCRMLVSEHSIWEEDPESIHRVTIASRSEIEHPGVYDIDVIAVCHLGGGIYFI